MIHFKDNGCPNWENGDITTGLLWDEYIEVARNDRNYCGLCIKHVSESAIKRAIKAGCRTEEEIRNYLLND